MSCRVFQISSELVEREPIFQQQLQRFPGAAYGAMHVTSGIIAASYEGSTIAFTVSISAKTLSTVFFAKRPSSCVGLCFTSVSGKLIVAHQDGFIFVYKVHDGSCSLTLWLMLLQVEGLGGNACPQECCVCAHDAPLVAVCNVPQTDDVASADESGAISRPISMPYCTALFVPLCILAKFFVVLVVRVMMLKATQKKLFAH
jgi:hypothetical protein